ncbi:hypothetical protein OESDEN_00937 [Oesophagostomum dentatum]|uniref:Calponin-homology (CH) domain-containing protein n=1 Tax=Oesophagostomum dentatum TaxID=61180 RepID=A0A0B1TUE8_OESDE|nr:hypothetical protein OESDEN_00937 [Oesophagostomum dentatum]
MRLPENGSENSRKEDEPEAQKHTVVSETTRQEEKQRMPLFGLRFSAPDEDERAQKNTFTRWINFHLEEHSSSGRVNDLFEDIKDGVLLCHLIEVLTGEALIFPFQKTNKAKILLGTEKRCASKVWQT